MAPIPYHPAEDDPLFDSWRDNRPDDQLGDPDVDHDVQRACPRTFAEHLFDANGECLCGAIEPETEDHPF